MRWFLVSLAVAGCASAGKENSVIGGLGDGGVDATDFPAIDASLIDAPPRQVTLAQTTSDAITPDRTVGCFQTGTGFVRPNMYYRLFAPADHNITTTLHVTSVSFAIERADAGDPATQQPARITVGTYGVPAVGNTLDLAELRTLAAVDIQIPDGRGTRMTVPIAADVPPTTNLIVELAVEDGTAAEHIFVIGSNGQGESKPGYLRAPTCNLAAPVTIRSITEAQRPLPLPESHIVLTVTGMI